MYSFAKKSAFLTCLVLLACISVDSSKVRAAPQPQNVLREFQTVVSELKSQTQVPLILPTRVPVGEFSATPDAPLPEGVPLEDGRFTTFFPYLLDATPTRYSISLDLIPGCMGAGACDFGYLSGEKITSDTPTVPENFVQYSELYRSDPNRQKPPTIRSPEPPSRVQLAGGITGYFIPYVCGANCSNSTVVWDQNGYRYTVGIEMGDKKTVVDLANSAIQNQQL